MVLLSPSMEQFLLLRLFFTFMPLLKIADPLVCRCYLSLGHLHLKLHPLETSRPGVGLREPHHPAPPPAGEGAGELPAFFGGEVGTG